MFTNLPGSDNRCGNSRHCEYYTNQTRHGLAVWLYGLLPAGETQTIGRLRLSDDGEVQCEINKN